MSLLVAIVWQHWIQPLRLYHPPKSLLFISLKRSHQPRLWLSIKGYVFHLLKILELVCLSFLRWINWILKSQYTKCLFQWELGSHMLLYRIRVESKTRLMSFWQLAKRIRAEKRKFDRWRLSLSWYFLDLFLSKSLDQFLLQWIWW